MSDRYTLRLYCEAVFAGGCLAVAPFIRTGGPGYIASHTLTFCVLAGGVLLGEMLPVKIPRRGGDEEITASSAFALALLLAGGLIPALLAQCTASVVQDRYAGKPWWRARFNLGQYALSMTAALLVLHTMSAGSHIGTQHPFSTSEIPAIMVAGAVFFLVNNGIVGAAVSMHQEVSLGSYFRNDIFFVIVTGGVTLLMAPLVVAVSAYSVYLVPLFLAPILAMYNTVWQGTRSHYAARHDALTGLPNRIDFHEAASDALRPGRPESCILLIDLDRFKEVNDTLGHRYGDVLLRNVAERFREQLDPDDRIARLGGDEFAILGRGRDRDGALDLANRLSASLKLPFELEHTVVDAQASAGIAMFPDDGTDVESLLQKADVAMYRAKRERVGVAVYDEGDDDHSPAKLALTVELRSALEHDQVVLCYQPLVSLSDDSVFAMEALVRWEHPALGTLKPASFVGIAEQINVIKPLTQRVLELSLAQLARWRSMNIDVSMAVNISAQVLVDPGFVERVLSALDHAGVPPTRLKLEVTESTLMVDPELARSVLQELSGHGIEISIDDFGTGYSSLAYLANLPASEVKIDRSFVSRMAAGSSETIIVSSTIDLAHNLGLRAVAEGVEDLALLGELRELGCDAVQGYAISRPLTAERMTQWLRASHKHRQIVGVVRNVA